MLFFETETFDALSLTRRFVEYDALIKMKIFKLCDLKDLIEMITGLKKTGSIENM